MFFKNKERILIVGLGNPGERYAKTRHNVGFCAIDELLPKLENSKRQEKLDGELFFGNLFDKEVILLRPQTFMNLSGKSVSAVARFYKIPVEKIYVIFDDISLAPGKLRLRPKGSAGGHNGIKDIISALGSDCFIHIKVGVGGKPHPDYGLADWVLSAPEGEDKEKIDAVLSTMPALFRSLFHEPFERTLNKFNH